MTAAPPKAARTHTVYCWRMQNATGPFVLLVSHLGLLSLSVYGERKDVRRWRQPSTMSWETALREAERLTNGRFAIGYNLVEGDWPTVHIVDADRIEKILIDTPGSAILSGDDAEYVLSVMSGSL